MAHLMAWPITDFDGVLFNDGSGADEVVAIHLAIKERADLTGHSLASGDYADEWPAGTVVWLADPDGDVLRLYLKDVLEKFYADISDLIDGDSDIRWTEGTGRTTEWTLASLVADIAMGDFADLLTGPTNHEPFLWLHEALDRLIYAKVTFSGLELLGTTSRRLGNESDADPDVASVQAGWTLALADTPDDDLPNDYGIEWLVRRNYAGGGGGYEAIASIHDNIEFSFTPGSLAGTIAALDWVLTWEKTNDAYFDGEMFVEWLSSSASNVFFSGTSQSETVAGVPADITLGSPNAIVFTTASEPATVPFSGLPVPDSGTPSYSGYYRCKMSGGTLWVDIASELADQA